MDKFDIAIAILSLTQMGDLLYDGTEKGAAAVRTGNDYGCRFTTKGRSESVFRCWQFDFRSVALQLNGCSKRP